MVKVLAVLAGATLVASGCTTAPSVPAIPKAKKSEDTVIAPAPAPAAKSSGFVYNGDNSVVESDDGCVRASGWSADLPNCGEAPAPVVEDVKELPAVAKPAQPEPVYVRETLNGHATVCKACAACREFSEKQNHRHEYHVIGAGRAVTDCG